MVTILTLIKPVSWQRPFVGRVISSCCKPMVEPPYVVFILTILNINRTFFFKISSLTLIFDQNINNSHVLSKGIHSTKLGIFPAKKSRAFERTTLFQRREVWPFTLWPEKQEVSLLSRGFPAKVLKNI